jgi:hypothetical protein
MIKALKMLALSREKTGVKGQEVGGEVEEEVQMVDGGAEEEEVRI